MFDRIDTFNMNLANQVSLWVALHTALPQEISRSNVGWSGKVKKNKYFPERAAGLVNGTDTYPFAGEA